MSDEHTGTGASDRKRLKRQLFIYGGGKRPKTAAAGAMAVDRLSKSSVSGPLEADISSDDLFDGLGDDRATERTHFPARRSEVDVFLERIRRTGQDADEVDKSQESGDVAAIGGGKGAAVPEDHVPVIRDSESATLSQKTRSKYAAKNFKPKLYTKKELLSLVKRYYGDVSAILSGHGDSYYYGLVLEQLERSQNEQIKPLEFVQLPLQLLSCGYLGQKRAMMVKLKLYLKFYRALSEAEASNRVVRWFGVDNFVVYVLVPEVCCRLVRDEFKLSSLDKAIDLMELTQDYGMYIMDEEDARELEYDSDVEDDEEMRRVRGELSIVPLGGAGGEGGEAGEAGARAGVQAGALEEAETETEGKPKSSERFVQDLIGISDSESGSEDSG